MTRFACVAFLVLTSCASSVSSVSRVWTVGQLNRHIVQLDGQTILVRGWLPKCHGRDCTLYPSKRAADVFWKNLGHNRILSIGHGSEFDRLIRDQVPAEIVLRARVNAECFRKNEIKNLDGTKDIIICADRSDDLVPIEIIGLRRESPPTEQHVRK